MIGLVAGILGGTGLVKVNSRYFRRRSFGFSLATTALVYFGIFALINILVVTFIFSNKYGLAALTPKLFYNEWINFLDINVISNLILWGFITLLTLFLLQVNDKFGPGILLKFLLGNYHQPRKEERIFMFMDMRSSTSIAEKIGNEKYFNLLNDIFDDLTDTIVNYYGEIYQYVGDEIVISWPLTRGIRNANFLNCYLEIQKKLDELRPEYKKTYNVEPEFKAGIHHGEVMAGEVGVIKKDIIYSGDVLNTAARIQEQCNPLNCNLLISKDTFDLLPNKEDYNLKEMGEIELRGKTSKINIQTLV